MLRFFENNTATLRQMLGQRILKCKLSSTVTTLVASVQVLTRSAHLLVQETVQGQVVVVVGGTDVLQTVWKRLNALSRLVVVVVMVFQF